MSEVIKKIQQVLKDAGLYTLSVDGAWGSKSQGALDTAIQQANTKGNTKMQIAWGNKVSPEFLSKVKNIVATLGMPADTGPGDLLSCIAWESGRTFSASVVNKAGSGATGLIQFMPATAIVYFNTAAEIDAMSDMQKKTAGLAACVALGKMTAEQQLDYVLKYFMPYKGKLKNLGDLYMAILWPKGVGQNDDYVLWDEATRPTTFRQNAGLDVNGDKTITRGECLIKIQGMKAEGLQAGNVLAA